MAAAAGSALAETAASSLELVPVTGAHSAVKSMQQVDEDDAEGMEARGGGSRSGSFGGGGDDDDEEDGDDDEDDDDAEDAEDAEGDEAGGCAPVRSTTAHSRGRLRIVSSPLTAPPFPTPAVAADAARAAASSLSSASAAAAERPMASTRSLSSLLAAAAAAMERACGCAEARLRNVSETRSAVMSCIACVHS